MNHLHLIFLIAPKLSNLFSSSITLIKYYLNYLSLFFIFLCPYFQEIFWFDLSILITTTENQSFFSQVLLIKPFHARIHCFLDINVYLYLWVFYMGYIIVDEKSQMP